MNAGAWSSFLLPVGSGEPMLCADRNVRGLILADEADEDGVL